MLGVVFFGNEAASPRGLERGRPTKAASELPPPPYPEHAAVYRLFLQHMRANLTISAAHRACLEPISKLLAAVDRL